MVKKTKKPVPTKKSKKRVAKAVPVVIQHPVTQYALDVTNNIILANKWVRLACQRHLDDLKNGAKRGLFFDTDAADHIIEFFEKFLVFYEGDFADKPFILTPHQKFFVGSIFGWKKIADNLRRFRTVYAEEAKGNGKALALDTLIPTPTGWSTIGNLQAGDSVFDEEGNVCKVIACTPVMKNHDCFKVVFSSGEEIVADAEHLWKTNKLCSGNSYGDAIRGVPKSKWIKNPKGGITVLRTTREIAATVASKKTQSKHPQSKWNHRVEVGEALNLDSVDLPVPPYTLGAWLGDGDSTYSRLTVAYSDFEIVDEISKDGISVKEHKKHSDTTARVLLGSGGRSQAARNKSLQTVLRGLGLLNNKHIPMQYLRSSISQRMSLLQGLMDTDGYVGKGGQCEITLCNKKLAYDVSALLITLGYKNTVRESDAKLNGRVVGRRWRISFTAYTSFPPVRLERKRACLVDEPKTRSLSKGRMIVECSPVPSVPVKCISVDSSSQMYLAGEGMIPTHNSPIAAGIGLYCLVFDEEPGGEIYAAATTRDQAGVLFRDARLYAEASEDLKEYLTIDKNNIAYDEANSFFRPVSSEHRGLDGKKPHVVLIDEIHEHPNDLVVRKMSAGTKTRRQSLIVEITNSGYDRKSICYQHHEYTEKVLQGVLQDDSWFGLMTGLDVCPKCAKEGKTTPQEGCKKCDDWRNEKVWEKANPNMNYLGPSFKEYLKRQVKEAMEMPSQENIVKRLNFCIWTEGKTVWIPFDKWSACGSAVSLHSLLGRPCYGGLDLAQVEDIAAWVLVFPPLTEEGKYEILCRFFIPKANLHEREKQHKVPYSVWERQGYLVTTPGNSIDEAFILEQIHRDSETFDIRELAYDAWGSSKIIADLEKIGFQTEEGNGRLLVRFRQGDVSMNPAMTDTFKLVLAKRLAHGNNPILNWHISNVVVEPGPTGLIKPNKQIATEKIDGAVAMIMALGRAALNPGPLGSIYDSPVEEIIGRMAFR